MKLNENGGLSSVPAWIVTIVLAVGTAFFTANAKLAAIETSSALQNERIERLEAGKIGKEVAEEWNKRFDRIENKIDRLVENKEGR